MNALANLADALSRLVLWAGRIGAWATIPMIALIIWDVVSRRFFATGSTLLQELEWHFHAVLFLLCLGFAYLRNAHIRIEIVREHMSRRGQLWLELAGCTLVLAPFCAFVIYYSVDLAWRAWLQNEGSPNVGGTPHWWIIKSFVPLGMLLLLLAGAAVAVRRVVLLFGPRALQERILAREQEEAVKR